MSYNENEDPMHEAAEGEAVAGLDLEAVQTKWLEKIEARRKDLSNFESEVKRALKWLRLGPDDRKNKAAGDRLNIAYANYEIMRTATYARPPKPVVAPKFGGGPRRAEMNAVAGVIERAIESSTDQGDVDASLKAARDDLLKTGRGQVWLRYEATFGEQMMQVLGPDASLIMVPQQIKIGERIFREWVSWRDYLEGRAPIWALVPWVARRVPMNKDKLKKRFGDDAISRAQVKFADLKTEEKNAADGECVWVWEIWCRESGKVYFIAEGAHEALEVSDPMIAFEGFFPCPEPAMSCFEDGSRTPIPEVILIEDQLVEIDALTKRINALRDALKVRGFYAKGATATTAAGAIERAIKTNDDREILIPVESWAANGKGELGIVWLPLDTVVSTIQQCTVMRKEAIELVYQVTGISDVMRGASEASETLGAQQIKAQWGSVRVRDKQGEMTRLARDVCRMTGEIICEQFEPKTIAEMAVYGFEGAMLPIMREEKLRGLMLEIETDSTIAPDEDRDKQRRIEFTTAIGGLVQQLLPVIQVAPELLPMAGEMMKFAAAGFRAGREMEKQIDAALQALQARVSQPAAPAEPDPAMKARAEADMAKAEATKVKAQADVMKSENDMRAEVARASLPPPMAMPQPMVTT